MKKSRQNGKKIFVCMACIFTCLFVMLFSGKIKVFADDSIPSDYKQTVFNQEDGLGSTEVNCIYQTETGYIWIGTDGGLYRYDGNQFTIYNLWDTGKDDVYFINSLFQDSAGRLWVSTNNYGLFCISGSDVKHFTKDYYSGVKCINCVTEGSDGQIYAATAYGVYSVDFEKEKLTRIENLSGYNVKGLTRSGDKVWGICNGNHIFTIDSKGAVVNNPADNLTDEEFSCITSTEDGTVYIGTIGNDVLKMTNFYDAELMHSGREGIRELYPYKDNLFAVTDSGVGYFSASGNFKVINNLKLDKYFSGMIIDYEGNLWITSSRMGILLMRKGKFSDFTERYSLPESVTNTVFLYDNELYIGTDDGLVILNKNKDIIRNKLTEYLDGNSVRDMAEDSEGNLWIATYRNKGIVEYKKNHNIVTIKKSEGLISNLVNCISISSNGMVAVGTEQGISLINTDGTVKESYGYSNGIEYPNIISILVKSDGKIYAGSDGGGIYQISNGKVKNYTEDDGLSSNSVSSIKQGKKGIWIGTDNGLSYYDETFRAVSLVDFSDNIYDIEEKSGKVYLIGSKGLLMATEDELLGTEPLKERYYASGDGLDKTFTVASHSILDSDGKLYICCNEGLVSFDTVKQNVNQSAPKLTVTSVDVDGKIYYYDQIGGKLTVPRNTRRISISFAVLSFTNRENMEVQYSLNGFDKTVQTLSGSDQMNAVYTNLDGGSYTLTVNAVSGDGIKSETPISFTIEKKLGFFEYKSVKIICFIIIIIMIFSVSVGTFRMRKKFAGKNRELEDLTKKHENAVKTNSAKNDYLANMSNDIKLPVNAMIRTAQDMLKQSSPSEVEETEGLQTIVEKGQWVLSQVEETIQLARLESGTVAAVHEPYSITTLICDISDRMLNEIGDKPIKFLVDIGENIPDILVGDYDKIRDILYIILDNAEEYTKEGSITLAVDCYEQNDKKDKCRENLVFSVSDTGIGISPDRLSHVFEVYYVDESTKAAAGGSGINLVIASRLAEIMDGELEAESTYGAGSTFTFSLMQDRPENDIHPAPVSENIERVSVEEAERMWAPEVSALLVDDDELSRNVSLSIIREMEIKCDTASSGMAAIDMVMTHHYDIVFMDIGMPVMNGLDALKEIRLISGDEYKKLPVIAMTEDALGKSRGELTANGFSDVILKPFDLAQFAGILNRFIDAGKIKYRTNDMSQYVIQSRYRDGLKHLEENFDVIGTIDRIGGNIDVYNRIMMTFYSQNCNSEDELREKFNHQYRAFRNRLHNIRTGSQNIGAISLAEMSLRLENAINLGNRDYVRDNLDAFFVILRNVIEEIQEYLEFVEHEKGENSDEFVAELNSDSDDLSKGILDGDYYAEADNADTNGDYAKNHSDIILNEEKTKKIESDESNEKVSVISIELLRNMKDALKGNDKDEILKIYHKIAQYTYVTDDMEFLSALSDFIHEGNSDAIDDLLTTYLDLKSES